VVGAAVTLGLAGAVAVRLGKLPIELLMVPPHPAANNPARSRVVGRKSLFAERLMLILPRRVWPTAGASVRPRRGSFVARARMTWSPGLAIRRLPDWADSASDTIVTARRRPWGQIRRFRRGVPPPHPAPERFDHGEQHPQDGSQQEPDSRGTPRRHQPAGLAAAFPDGNQEPELIDAVSERGQGSVVRIGHREPPAVLAR
jgi:hypothetical protein